MSQELDSMNFKVLFNLNDSMTQRRESEEGIFVFFNFFPLLHRRKARTDLNMYHKISKVHGAGRI